MYSVLQLHGAQILVQYTQVLPYIAAGANASDTSYSYVRPKPDVFKMQEGRYFTLLVGDMHVVALIKAILSRVDDHAPRNVNTNSAFHEQTFATANLSTQTPSAPGTPIPIAGPHDDTFPTPTPLTASPPVKLKRSSMTYNMPGSPETPIRAEKGKRVHLATPDSLIPVPCIHQAHRSIISQHSREKELPALPETSKETRTPETPELALTGLEQNAVPSAHYDSVIPHNNHLPPIPPVVPYPDIPGQHALRPYTPHTPSPLKESILPQSTDHSNPRLGRAVPASAAVYDTEKRKVSEISPSSTSSSTSRKRQAAVPSTRTQKPKSKPNTNKDASKRVRKAGEAEKRPNLETIVTGKGEVSLESKPAIPREFSSGASFEHYGLMHHPGDRTHNDIFSPQNKGL